MVSSNETSGATKGAGGGLSTPQSKIGVPCNSSKSEDFFSSLLGGGVGYLLGVSYNKHYLNNKHKVNFKLFFLAIPIKRKSP